MLEEIAIHVGRKPESSKTLAKRKGEIESRWGQEVMEEGGFVMSMAGKNWEITVDICQRGGKTGRSWWVPQAGDYGQATLE